MNDDVREHKRMSNQPDDIRQWIQELISRSAADNMQNLKRFEEMLRRTLRGEGDPTALREEYLRFAQQESSRYINDLTRVGLSFYNTLLELNRHYNDRFFEHVLKEQRNAPGGAEKAAPRVIPMALSGPLGGDASRSFVIENQRGEPAAVSFLVSEFTSQDGAASFRPPLQLSPARFSLKPGEERVVGLQIPLLKEFFVPGQVYEATVIVSGFEDLQLQLQVRADPPPAPAAEAAPPARRGPVFQPVEETPVPPAAAAAPPPEAAPPADDLGQVKGIGPATVRKLHAGGIRTFARLADCAPGDLERILGAGGAARAHREQWQEQARTLA
jgi:predicted flap endonuclease-1-like 5' DNA nuclease